MGASTFHVARRAIHRDALLRKRRVGERTGGPPGGRGAYLAAGVVGFAERAGPDWGQQHRTTLSLVPMISWPCRKNRAALGRIPSFDALFAANALHDLTGA